MQTLYIAPIFSYQESIFLKEAMETRELNHSKPSYERLYVPNYRVIATSEYVIDLDYKRVFNDTLVTGRIVNPANKKKQIVFAAVWNVNYENLLFHAEQKPKKYYEGFVEVPRPRANRRRNVPPQAALDGDVLRRMAHNVFAAREQIRLNEQWVAANNNIVALQWEDEIANDQ